MEKKKLLRSAITGLAVLGVAATGQAFHEGGVGHCDGCHSMHNSPENPVSGSPNSSLLRGTDASSTCLNCHDQHGNANGLDWRYHVLSDDGNILSAGGDFFWVNKTFTNDINGTVVVLGGDNNGHNIIAVDYGLIADPNPSNAQAPGGTYPANKLGCTSCHDAHGQVAGGTRAGQAAISGSGSYGADWPTDGSILGNYRLLGDSAYSAGDSSDDGYNFTNDAPIARADSYSGKSVDYGSGMSEWCANCHIDFLVSDSDPDAKHPSGNDVEFGRTIDGTTFASLYNAYVATGEFTGVQSTSYDDLVPFERGLTDRTLTNTLDTTSTVGPDATSNVMCLSCHRVHASANANIGRWDFTVALLVESHALISNSLTPIEKEGVYYADGVTVDIGVRYNEQQRSLCNKCHVQD